VALVEAATSPRVLRVALENVPRWLRYLEQLEFGLVREALHERELSLTTLAPHLVKPCHSFFH